MKYLINQFWVEGRRRSTLAVGVRQLRVAFSSYTTPGDRLLLTWVCCQGLNWTRPFYKLPTRKTCKLFWSSQCSVVTEAVYWHIMTRPAVVQISGTVARCLRMPGTGALQCQTADLCTMQIITISLCRGTLADPAVALGETTWRRDPSQDTKKNWKLRGFRSLFWEEANLNSKEKSKK